MSKAAKHSHRHNRRQKGGLLPLLALLAPVLTAAVKAAALGAVGEAASYGAKNVIEAATRKRRR